MHKQQVESIHIIHLIEAKRFASQFMFCFKFSWLITLTVMLCTNLAMSMICTL